MQHKFLLLVALTPKRFLNPLRSELQRLSLDSIRQIEYDNCEAIVLGDEEGVDGKLRFVKSPEGSKGDRLAFALKYLKEESIDYDYIARFDDDDIINPKTMARFTSTKGDCFADRFHGFYDLFSGCLALSEKDWLANTVFMKRQHALAQMKDGRTLIEQENAEKWQHFFRGKEVVYASKPEPIYFRVLSTNSNSPTGI